MFRHALLLLATPTLCVGHGNVIKAVTPTQFEFRLSGLNVQTVGHAALSVGVSGWATLNIRSEPDLPVIRAPMILPHKYGTWKAVVRDVQKTVIPLEGKKVLPSPGLVSLCGGDAIIPANTSGPAYQGVYPQSNSVSLGDPYTWRDVYGAVLQILPVTVDHPAGIMEVLSSCTIELVSTENAPPAVAKRVDPDFHGAYSFVYANFDHYADLFLRDDKLGRVLVVHEAQFKDQAQTYADWIKQQGFQEVIIYEAGRSSDDVKSVISQHYKEPAGLTYVTIIGRNAPAPRGSHSQKECDNCYAQLSGKSLDVFVGRLSGASAGDIDNQLAKIKAYDSNSTAAWTTRFHGTAFNLAGDEYKTMTDIAGNFEKMGFSEHSWEHGSSASGRDQIAKMNKGLGVFSYLGHGSGSAWNTPSISVRDIQGLTNHDMPFFEIDVSCNNGGFQSHSPCLGEALLTSKGGAIATMMSAPTARGTMCKHQMVQQSAVLQSGKASRVGQVYFTALTAAQAQDPDDYMLEAYNVFGDPTLRLAFAKSPSSPSPIVVV